MADATPAPAPAPAKPVYYEVTLVRAVELYGGMFRPSERNVVDEATLKLMGDAVSEKKIVEG